MDKDFWLQAWVDGRTAFHQNEYNPTLVEITKDMELRNKHVFIPLAGKSKDIIYFLERGAQVFAVELSQQAVEEFFKENKIEALKEDCKNHTIYRSKGLTFYQGDFFTLTKDEIPTIDFLYDRASLVALPPSMREEYYKKINHLIKQETKVLLLTYRHDGEDPNFGPPFYVPIEEIKDKYLKEHTMDFAFEGVMKTEKESRFGQAGISELQRIMWTHNI